VGRSGWNQALANGASFGQVATAILSSAEYAQDVVEEAYGLLLRRRADATGLNNFTTFLNQGGRDETLIAASDEYFNRLSGE
jgi:hypothetical protein